MSIDDKSDFIIPAYHVVPVGDRKKHKTNGKECACNPRVERQSTGIDLVIHEAYDRREFDEIANEINDSL